MLLNNLVAEDNKKLLEEGLKVGVVKMRYIVCITVGLPGVGKTCLKFLLMGQPPPELRCSTICAERPIRIEVQVRAISDIKLRSSGEQWIEVDNEGMLEIVAQMILLISEQHPESGRFLFKKNSHEPTGEVDLPQQGEEAEHCGEVGMEKEIKESLVSRFIRWIKLTFRKRTHQPDPSHNVVVADPQPTVISEACETAVSAVMAKLVQTITRLQNKKPGEVSSQPSRSLLESIWVYLSDCGGQPQYHELLPLFIQHISVALCVLRLPDQLDEVQAIDYYSEDQLLGVTQQSQFSAKDTIRCLVSTIQSFSNKGQKPSIILIGTHRDILEGKSKQEDFTHSFGKSSQPQGTLQDPTVSPLQSLEEKNQQLLEMLEPEFSDQLIYHSKDMKQLLFPLNTLKPEGKDKAKATAIRKAVENSPAQEVEVPIWWYIYELLLQELAKQLGRKVLSRAECLEVANQLNVEERDMEAALMFFNELNVIKYSPKVLPKVVFTDSQVPLDKVSELVRESYLLRGDPSVEQSNFDSTPVEGKWKHFRDHGVVTPELMRKFPSHYVPGIFTIDDLSELFKDLLVFAPIPMPDWAKPPPGSSPSPTTSPSADSPSLSPSQNVESYFVMPACLVTLSDAELKKHRTSSTMVATLLVKFPQASRRAGVFCCFAVHLIRHCGWKPLLDAKEPLYRNCIKIHLMVSPPCTVTMIDSNSFIEVHTDVSAQATVNECARLLPVLKTNIFSGITAACKALNYKQTHPEIGFICPHFEASSPGISQNSQLHSASITSDTQFWCCDVNTKINSRLENRHHIWFGRGKFTFKLPYLQCLIMHLYWLVSMPLPSRPSSGETENGFFILTPSVV